MNSSGGVTVHGGVIAVAEWVINVAAWNLLARMAVLANVSSSFGG